VLGVVRGLHAFLPHLLERGSGHIVVTSSQLGLYVSDGLAGPYVASKFALVGLTRSLAIYLRPKGIGVTLLAPRLTDTAFPRSTVAWGARGPRVRSDREVAGADTPETVAAMLVGGLRADRFLVCADPDMAARLTAFAEDPDGDVHRWAGPPPG